MSGMISKSVRRVDALDKCSGSARYVADLKFDGMLYAKTLRSTKPRAKIISIRIPPLPEGYCVVDKSDVPGRNRVKMLIYDQPFFAEDVVNYVGEPILLVVGPDREKILRIISQIEVVYEDIEPILSMEDAESGEKPSLFGDDNCFVDYQYTKGAPDEAFANATTIIEGEYETGYQEHIYLEPQGVIGVYEDDKVTVYGSMQCPYYVKRAVMECLGWCEERVRIVQTTTGGAFGGKEEYPSIIAGQVAVAAVKTNSSVKLIFDRTEDIECTTKRHPSITRYRTAVDEFGKITAMDVDIKFDGGAYAGLSDVVLQRAMFSATGVYNVPNVRVRGRAFATNKVPTGAFRGFGAPQVFFAVEMQMEKIASQIGINPIELRLKNAIQKGNRTSTGGILRQNVKLPEMVAMASEMSGIREKVSECRKSDSRFRRGIGMSLCFHGCGFTGKGEEIIRGKASLKKNADGIVEILVANTEMGQGALTALRKIVADTLAIPMENVKYDNPDTERVPDSGPTVASRTTMIIGNLLKQAAEEMAEKWNETNEIEISKVYEHPDYIEWNQDKFEGDAYPTYSWGVNVVELEVDTLTGEIAIEKVWAVFDVGVPIDEKLMRGQIEGGIAQGIGYATIEVMQNKNGKFLQNTITDYVIPTAMDLPQIESRLIENPYEFGPFGAKCAGELTFVGVAPAVAAAVKNAIGIDINKLPITPESIVKELEGEN